MGKDSTRKAPSAPTVKTGARSSGAPATPGAAAPATPVEESRDEESPHKKARGGEDNSSMIKQFQELSSNLLSRLDVHMATHTQAQSSRMDKLEGVLSTKMANQDLKFEDFQRKFEEKDKRYDKMEQKLVELQEAVDAAKASAATRPPADGRGAPTTPVPNGWPYRTSRPQSSPAGSASSVRSSGTVTEAVNTTACVGLKEETRRADYEIFLNKLVKDLMPDTVPLAVYTIYKRATAGYIRFANASQMWQFVMRVKAASATLPPNTWVAPKKTSDQIKNDKPMNAFLKTFYTSMGAPARKEMDAEFKLGKV